MLESQLFGTETDDFEDTFDDIIYKTEFLKDFERPVVPNPFRSGLQKALIDWLEKYKTMKLAWRKTQQILKND